MRTLTMADINRREREIAREQIDLTRHDLRIAELSAKKLISRRFEGSLSEFHKWLTDMGYRVEG